MLSEGFRPWVFSKGPRLRLLTFVLVTLVFIGCTPPEIVEAVRLEKSGYRKSAVLKYADGLAKMREGSRERLRYEKHVMGLRRSIVDEVLAEAKEVYGVTPTLSSVKKAVGILNDARTYDDREARIAKYIRVYENVRKKLESDKQQKLQDAEETASRLDWAQAITLLREAAATDPSDAQIRLKVSQMVERRDRSYKQRVAAVLAKDDWRTASRIAAKFAEERPPPEAAVLNYLQNDIKAVTSRLVASEVQACVANKQYYTAYTLVREAGSDLGAQMSIIREDGAAYYSAVAKKSFAAKQIGRAYFAALKAKEIDASYPGVLVLHRDISDAIDRLLRVQIAISGFDSPKKQPDAGPQLSDTLIAYLVQHLPYGIEILERTKIDIILREKGSRLAEVSKLLDVKYFIIGRVATLTVEHQRADRESTVVITAGTTTRPNPEYDAMVRRYGRDSSSWPSRPPETITENKTAVVKHRFGDESVHGVLNASVRIFDATRGRVTYAKDFSAEEKAKDSFRDPIPAADPPIQYDPLELPADVEIENRLRAKVVSQVAAVVLQLFDMPHFRFLTISNEHTARLEYDKALDALAQGHLYCLRDTPRVRQDDKYRQEISRKGLFDLTESSPEGAVTVTQSQASDKGGESHLRKVEVNTGSER